MARALKVCSTAGCPTLVPSGRCDQCKRQAERKRGSAAQRGYGHAWAKWAKRYLTRHPFCDIRLDGCTGLATLPDHHPVSRRDLVARGVRQPDQDRYCRAACAHCHGVETARHQPGGWHAM